eukprot:617-Pelagococcus_subviridis.AAC.1
MALLVASTPAPATPPPPPPPDPPPPPPDDDDGKNICRRFLAAFRGPNDPPKRAIISSAFPNDPASPFAPPPCCCTASTNDIICDWNCSVACRRALSRRTSSVKQKAVALELLHLARDPAVRADLERLRAVVGRALHQVLLLGAAAAARVRRRRRPRRRFPTSSLSVSSLFVSRRVVPPKRRQELRLPLLEPLHAKLEPVAVAFPEPVVVQLPHERREVAVLERVRKMLRLEEVRLPDRERPPVRAPRDDVVARRVGDEVPRLPASAGGTPRGEGRVR